MITAKEIIVKRKVLPAPCKPTIPMWKIKRAVALVMRRRHL